MAMIIDMPVAQFVASRWEFTPAFLSLRSKSAHGPRRHSALRKGTACGAACGVTPFSNRKSRKPNSPYLIQNKQRHPVLIATFRGYLQQLF